MKDRIQLFKLAVTTQWRGNSFPFIVDNVIEATPYFARAFYEAGRDRVTQIKQAGGGPDYEALPVVFLYRHAIELALKGLIWNADELASFEPGKLKQSGAPGPDKVSHDLEKLLPFVDHALNEFNLKWANKDITWEDAKYLIKDINNVDPLSYTFRYPMTRKGDPSQSPKFVFNLYDFADVLNPVLEALLDLCHDLEDYREKFHV